MTLAIKHNFVTAKADGTDSTLLKPSNWNEAHVITLAAATLVGRQTLGDGPAEEIPFSAAAAAMLAAADIAGILAVLGVSPPLTGDGKFTLRAVADPGWVLMNDGTIGDGLSTVAATARGNADTNALFTLLYNNILDANAPVFTSAGVATTRAALGTAATAFGAHALMLLPRQLGRAIVAAGAGPGLTARALGSAFGEELHVISVNEMPSHAHANSLTDPTHTHNFSALQQASGALGIVGSSNSAINNSTTGTAGSGTGVAISNAAAGGGAAANITQASAGWNVMVKL